MRPAHSTTPVACAVFAFLHTSAPAPFFSAFDPFRGLQFARRERAWIIDYLHCPLEQPVHENKDCSAAQLRERIETVVAEGGEEVWFATVEDPLDYRYARRYVQVRALDTDVYGLSAPNLPREVQRRSVTIALPPDTRGAELDGTPLAVYGHAGRPLVDVGLASVERRLRIYRDTVIRGRDS